MSYLHILKQQNSVNFESWNKFGYHCNDRSAQCFAKGLIRQLVSSDSAGHTATIDAAEKWLQTNPTFLVIWREVFSFLYAHNSNGKQNKLSNSSNGEILPLQVGKLCCGALSV